MRDFVLGVVLALVVAISGSLWASVIVHFVNNFISITLTAYIPQVDEIYAKLGYYNWLTGAASVAIGLILRAAGVAGASFDGMDVFSWCGYALMQVGFVCTVLVYSKVRKYDLVYVSKMRGKLNPLQITVLPFIAIATILVFLPLANAWTAFLNVIGYHGSGVAMPDYSNVGVYFLSLLLMAVLPAFGEELLIRGNLFSGLSTRNIWFGVLISALMFSLMHANPVQTVHQFGLGVVLALVVAISATL